MKVNWDKLIAIVWVSAAAFALVLMILIFLFPEQGSGLLTEPPAGWKIQTDGMTFRWMDNRGRGSVFDFRTKQEAVDNAWSYYEFVPTEKRAWVEVKP